MSLAEPLIAAKLFRDVNVGRPHVSAPLDRLLQTLLGHLREQHGIVVLTGAPGSGKTIALRQLALDAEPGIAARIVSATARTTPDELYEAVLQRLKAAPLSPDEPPLARLQRSLPGAMPYPALLVDDAENLAPACLAAIAELAAPRNGTGAITVLLASRLEPSALLRGAVDSATLRPAAMPRLSQAQLEPFIRARLRAAQLPLDMFPGPVLETLGVQSEGLPAALIRLAGDALERAIGAGRRVVTAADLAPTPAPSLPPPDLPPVVIAPRPKQTPPETLPLRVAAEPAPPPDPVPPAPPPVSFARETFKAAVLGTAALGVAATLLVLAPDLVEHAATWMRHEKAASEAIPAALAEAPSIEAAVPAPDPEPEPPAAEAASASESAPAVAAMALPADDAVPALPDPEPEAPPAAAAAVTAAAPPTPVEPQESLAVAMAIEPAARTEGVDGLADLFREAQAAIAAASADPGPVAPAQAPDAPAIDPTLRLTFERFLRSLEAAPAPATVPEAALRQSFEQFLARVGALGTEPVQEAERVEAR
jgi:type II secretory pathway predicted ATPase ExeA